MYVRLGRHHEDRLDLRVESSVHERHLQLVLEIGNGPKPADDDVSVSIPRIVDEESSKCVDLDAGLIAEDFASRGDALLGGEQRGFVHVDQDGDDDPVEEFRSTLDDVDVAVGEGVERPGIDREARRLVRHPVTRVAGEGSFESW